MNGSENGSVFALQVAEDIVPIGEFKAHLSEKIHELRDRHRPLIVTQNGKAAAVLLAPEEFDRLTTQAYFVAAVQEGLADLNAGHVISDDEVGRRLDARYGSLTKSKK
ncbi:MAG: type II toxin-antitoxin system Phd/YefM family antitoxin [Polyangiaceae bacterium]|nr:type II toxin-antitoxin system Phd/YefM family antitoxin [Polyangiaceae bacterium]